MKKRVANIIVEQIAKMGVHYIFGVTGKAISAFIDAILDYDSVEFIAAKHESGAALMAYGYAQASGKIGVCCGTTGGGTTNLATGVATAFMNSVPLLVITGQVSTFEFGKGAFQESTGIGQSINSVEFFKSITKQSLSIDHPSEVISTLGKAIKTATTGRMGPVHINIPFNIQLTEIDSEIKTIDSSTEDETPDFRKEIESVIQLMQAAEKPAFLLGWGSVLSGAHREITEIAEKYNIPVATTLQGKGAIPSNHYLCLGVMGVCGHSSASDYIFEKADLLIAVGTTFGEFSTFNWDERITKDKKLIQIDIDHREIGKNYSVDIGITGDASLIIKELHQELITKEFQPKKEIALEHPSKKYINPHIMEAEHVPLKPQRIFKELREDTPDNTLFLADSGAHWAWAMHYLPVHKGGGFYPTLGLGSMGASICSAIGVKLGKSDHPVICICGDGSFLMYGNEVTTAEHYNIPVIWVILNDSRYNLPAISMKKQYNRTIGVDFKKIDFSKLADVFGIKGYRVEKPGDLKKALKEAIALNGPVVIDAVIDPEEIPPVGKRKLNP